MDLLAPGEEGELSTESPSTRRCLRPESERGLDNRDLEDLGDGREDTEHVQECKRQEQEQEQEQEQLVLEVHQGQTWSSSSWARP